MVRDYTLHHNYISTVAPSGAPREAFPLEGPKVLHVGSSQSRYNCILGNTPLRGRGHHQSLAVVKRVCTVPFSIPRMNYQCHKCAVQEGENKIILVKIPATNKATCLITQAKLFWFDGLIAHPSAPAILQHYNTLVIITNNLFLEVGHSVVRITPRCQLVIPAIRDSSKCQKPPPSREETNKPVSIPDHRYTKLTNLLSIKFPK